MAQGRCGGRCCQRARSAQRVSGCQTSSGAVESHALQAQVQSSCAHSQLHAELHELQYEAPAACLPCTCTCCRCWRAILRLL